MMLKPTPAASTLLQRPYFTTTTTTSTPTFLKPHAPPTTIVANCALPKVSGSGPGMVVGPGGGWQTPQKPAGREGGREGERGGGIGMGMGNRGGSGVGMIGGRGRERMS